MRRNNVKWPNRNLSKDRFAQVFGDTSRSAVLLTLNLYFLLAKRRGPEDSNNKKSDPEKSYEAQANYLYKLASKYIKDLPSKEDLISQLPAKTYHRSNGRKYTYKNRL